MILSFKTGGDSEFFISFGTTISQVLGSPASDCFFTPINLWNHKIPSSMLSKIRHILKWLRRETMFHHIHFDGQFLLGLLMYGFISYHTLLRMILRILEDLGSISRIFLSILNILDYFQIHSLTQLRLILRHLEVSGRISRTVLRILNTHDSFQI